MPIDYFNKYLKYKKKYFQLSKDLHDNTYYYEYYSDINEFCHRTKEEYRNCGDFPLNMIRWRITNKNDVTNLQSDYDDIIDKENNVTNMFLQKFFSNEKMIYIEQFNNNTNDYTAIFLNNKPGSLVPGAFIPEEKIPNVFTNISGIPSIPVSKLSRTYNVKKGFYPSKGSGKINLHNFALEMKSRGFNYIILSADGGPQLVSFYESFGFRKFLKVMLSDIEIRFEMFGIIDEIIDKTI